MYKHLVVVIALSSLCCLLYGIVNILLDVEKNACHMTYMYQMPTFIKIKVEGAKNFSKYNLYAYAEGSLIEKARSQQFNGAPVIFVPGNSGSHKQGRSLGSTALRKGLDHDLNYHLDYFLVDYNEEFSALFGGYLTSQRDFLKQCIFSVLKLYKNLPNPPKQVVLIGHSMGGKVAQSLLTDPSVSDMINTIIFIATPLDQPVVNFDVYMEAFYRESNKHLETARTLIEFKNDTNYCATSSTNIQVKSPEDNKSLDDKLLISIGGGNRDLLVHAGLTYSKFNDINVMASAIPNVWLSTDHVASVWCLQLVLVINRFLFSIISASGSGRKQVLSFTEEKPFRLSKASFYFVDPKISLKRRNDVSLVNNKDTDEWYEDSRRVFNKDFKNGVDHLYIQMIPLNEKRQYKELYAEAINLDVDEWVFGCDAKEFTRNMRYCSAGHSLAHYVEKIPNSPQKRIYLSMDLHKIKKLNPTWTHVILRIPPTKNNVQLSIDIHDPEERTLRIKAPKWYSYTEQQLIADTTLGASHYKILMADLEESYQSVKFTIKPRVCSKPTHFAAAKTCVPWAKGNERYQNFSDQEINPLLVHVPFSKPLGYNTTANPVTVNLHLDPNCRYQITYQNSFGGTASRIFQQYIHWLPAHLSAVLFLSFKYQVSLTPNQAPFKCGKIHSAIVNSGSFFIITATRIFAKLVQSASFLPDPDDFHRSMLISFIIHGSATAILLLCAAALWTFITFYGNVIHSIFLRLTKLSSPVFSVLMPIIERFPFLAGGALIAVAFGSCGGVALILGCFIYFMLIAKEYEDYLENFVYDTVVAIAKRLFGKIISEPEKTEEFKSPTSSKNENEIHQSNIEKSEAENETEALMELEKENDNDVEEKNSDIEEVSNDIVSQEEDEELEQLLNEAIEKQKEVLKEKQEKRKQERKEYDSVHEGLIKVHFHMTLFLLMCVLTMLYVPTTIAWARDFRYSSKLSPDPSLFPATVVLTCMTTLWQLSAPRNLHAYNFVASILYVCAAICIIYCQDSVYRVGGVISTVFVMVTIHQLFSSRKTGGRDLDPAEAELEDRIEKMKAVLASATEKS